MLSLYITSVNNTAENIQFSMHTNSVEHIESTSCLAICKVGASIACLLLRKLALIALYHKLKRFTNIIIHIFT